MRKIRELLRPKYELGRSHREIAASLGIANSTVSDYASRAAAGGRGRPLLAVAGGAGRRRAGGGAVPGPAAVAGSPARARLTVRAPGASAPQGRHATAAVAGEYRTVHPNGYQYSRFCDRYRAWRGHLDAGPAAGLPGRREGVRGLRGAEVRGRGPEHRRGMRRHGLRRCPRRLELHVRGRDLEPRAAGLGDVPTSGRSSSGAGYRNS